MSYDIACINGRQRDVDYSAEAVADYEAGLGDGIDLFTLRFERDYADALVGTSADDIGGLIVYLREGEPVAVYDYENFCAWFLDNI